METKKEFKLTEEEREHLTHVRNILEELFDEHIDLPCNDREDFEEAVSVIDSVLCEDAGDFNPWRK